MPHAVHAGWGSGAPLVLRVPVSKESMRRRLHRDLHCGLAGRAYAMLAMHRLTGEAAWLDRAHVLAERAAAGIDGDGLFKGAAGVAVLFADLQNPDDARFPLFD